MKGYHLAKARSGGFTLLEIMAAVAIIAILAAISIPLYTQYSQRSYRTEVQADLMNCAQALERFNEVNFTYVGAADTVADGLADGANGTIGEDICAANSVRLQRYAITIAATPNTFTLTAVPDVNGPNAEDGDLTLDDAGNRTWDHDDNGTIEVGVDDNWEEE